MDSGLKRIISRIEEIPTLPVVSQKILNVISDPDASYKDIVSLVEYDQALALKILKVANSAFYGSIGKVSSLEHAMVKLGLNEVKSIVLGVSVYNFFSGGSNGLFDIDKFWEHSIVCSQVSKYLGNHFRIKNNDMLFLGGLIHDMGKVVIGQYFQEDFLKIIEYIDENHSSFSEAEKAVIGTTHYQIAAKLLNQWNFPKEAIMYILYHHAPWGDKNFESGSIILYLANMITKIAGYYCHDNEKIIDPLEFTKSSQAAYINKNGFDLGGETLMNIITHVKEYIAEEANNVMKIFK
ncbi:MAG: HDOD domain-containing protein [Deltaproteobacteria bacterium]|nr:HDOD domain-containing protein [Deltaproteobacteria bacterium]